jgi:hypothetical protein
MQKIGELPWRGRYLEEHNEQRERQETISVEQKPLRYYNDLRMTDPANDLQSCWSITPEVAVARLGVTLDGLTRIEAQKRLRLYGYNTLNLEGERQFGVQILSM